MKSVQHLLLISEISHLILGVIGEVKQRNINYYNVGYLGIYKCHCPAHLFLHST